ncbi:MAG: fused MFS/spermidine synthase, partial [Planctomycetota bacterium]
MVLELVAGRLIARFLGASLYTWTSVIGVVLAGITLGNYLGGRIADRFSPRKALAVLFAIASLTCIATVALNNLVPLWTWLWRFNWPLRVFSHVSIVFLVPSVLLGTISPVVAKMALDRGLATGRTVGDIYAWGAAGSIVGTFAAGYYLIAAMGTVAIIWMVAAVLLFVSILYWSRFKALYVLTLLLASAMATSLAPWAWARKAGAALALRQPPDDSVIYETESQYTYIQVRRISEKPEKRHFLQDKLVHSAINMDNTSDLEYHYEQVYAAVTARFSRAKEDLSFLTLGGGGYVFPSYIERVWPGSRNDVVEIDPAVTETAMGIFYPRENTSIRTISMDARNYVDELVERRKTTAEKITYDFIYEDALNSYSVPYQLTTREFNEKLAQILKEDGIYLVELIDNTDSGLFVGAFVNTLELTFPHVYVISDRDAEAAATRQTFVVIASR